MKCIPNENPLVQFGRLSVWTGILLLLATACSAPCTTEDLPSGEATSPMTFKAGEEQQILPGSGGENQPREKTVSAVDQLGLEAETPEQYQNLKAGQALAVAGDREAAAAHFEAVIAGGPTSLKKVDAYLALGEVQMHQGKGAEMVATYELAAKLAPRVPQVNMALGRGYLTQGRHMDAAVALERALELQPNLLEAYPDLNKAYQALQNHKQSTQLQRAYKEQLEKMAAQIHSQPTEQRLGFVDAAENAIRMGNLSARSYLEQSLQDQHPSIRARAAEALGRYGGETGHKHLVQRLGLEEEQEVQAAIKHALSHLEDGQDSNQTGDIGKDLKTKTP